MPNFPSSPWPRHLWNNDDFKPGQLTYVPKPKFSIEKGPK